MLQVTFRQGVTGMRCYKVFSIFVISVCSATLVLGRTLRRSHHKNLFHRTKTINQQFDEDQQQSGLLSDDVQTNQFDDPDQSSQGSLIRVSLLGNDGNLCGEHQQVPLFPTVQGGQGQASSLCGQSSSGQGHAGQQNFYGQAQEGGQGPNENYNENGQSGQAAPYESSYEQPSQGGQGSPYGKAQAGPDEDANEGQGGGEGPYGQASSGGSRINYGETGNGQPFSGATPHRINYGEHQPQVGGGATYGQTQFPSPESTFGQSGSPTYGQPPPSASGAALSYGGQPRSGASPYGQPAPQSGAPSPYGQYGQQAPQSRGVLPQQNQYGQLHGTSGATNRQTLPQSRVAPQNQRTYGSYATTPGPPGPPAGAAPTQPYAYATVGPPGPPAGQAALHVPLPGLAPSYGRYAGYTTPGPPGPPAGQAPIHEQSAGLQGQGSAPQSGQQNELQSHLDETKPRIKKIIMFEFER